MHFYLVLQLVLGLIVVCGKRSSSGYEEVHVHIVVATVTNVHVVAVGVVLVVVIVVVVVLVGVVDDVGGNSGGNNSCSEITPD